MVASSIRNHVEVTYGKFMTQTREVEVVGGGLEMYVVSFPLVLTSVVCLVEGCLARTHNPVWIH